MQSFFGSKKLTCNGSDGIERRSSSSPWQLSDSSSFWHTCHSPSRPALSPSTSPIHSREEANKYVTTINSGHRLRVLSRPSSSSNVSTQFMYERSKQLADGKKLLYSMDRVRDQYSAILIVCLSFYIISCINV